MAVPVAVLVKEQTNPMLVKAVVESEGMLGAGCLRGSHKLNLYIN